MTASKSLVGHLPQDLVAQDARVGDDHVEAAEVLDRRCDESLRGLRGPHRCHHRDGTPPVGGDLGDGRVGGLLVDVVDHDRRAVTREFLRVGQAETLTTTGDDGDLVAEIHNCSSLTGCA